MSKTTKIEWCDSTMNSWIGCTKVSPACDHCYAEKATPSRTLQVVWGPTAGRHRTSAANWRMPLRWNAEAFWQCACCGWRGTETEMERNDDGFGAWRACPECRKGSFTAARRRVFCLSLGDVADNQVDPAWRVDLLQLIAKTPNLDWLLLTKRIGILERLLDDALGVLSHGLTRWRDAPWPNVWIGATITSQAEADRDLPKLMATPAARRFVSMEPLLGPVNLEPWLTRTWPNCDLGFAQGDVMPPGYCQHCAGHISDPIHSQPERVLDWVIVGGESGPRARPMRPSWALGLRDQCADAGTPFLFKQWGEWGPADCLVQHRSATVQSATWEADQWAFQEMAMSRVTRRVEDQPELYRVGKRLAGRLLQGKAHTGFPASAVTWPAMNMLGETK